MTKKTLALLLFSILIGTSASAQERKVLIIGIDGLLPEAVGLAQTPNLNDLYRDENGFLAHGYTEDLTFSGPSWSSILHGVHRDRHGVDSNRYDGHDFSDWPNLMDRLREHDSGLHTAAFVTWPLLRNNFSRPDGSPAGTDLLVYRDRREDGDEQVTEELVSLLRDGDPDAVFFYQNDLDAAGHGQGFSIEESAYRDQLRETDERIGRVLEALAEREGVVSGDEEWLILVVTDHGGESTGHSGNLYRQRFIPLILNGPGVGSSAPEIRVRNVDVARTALGWMGVPQEELADLDGNDILELAAMEWPEPAYGENLLFNGDGEFDRGFADRSIDQAISGWAGQELTGQLDGYHGMTLLTVSPEVEWIGEDGEPVDAGGSQNLFAGGSKGHSPELAQHVDLLALSGGIDARQVRFRLSAFLGAEAGDRMALNVFFLDRDGNVTRSAVVSSDAGECEGRTGEAALCYRETDGIVPVGTRRALVRLQAAGGSGDGVRALADRLSLVLEIDRSYRPPQENGGE